MAKHENPLGEFPNAQERGVDSGEGVFTTVVLMLAIVIGITLMVGHFDSREPTPQTQGEQK